MRAPCRRADAVHIGSDHLVSRFGPLQGGFHLFVLLARHIERLFGHGGLLAVRVGAPVERVGLEVGGLELAVAEDAIAVFHFGEW